MCRSIRLWLWMLLVALAVLSVPVWPRPVIVPCAYVYRIIVTNRWEAAIGHLAEAKMPLFPPLCTKIVRTYGYMM
jgi:hypothetical protein